MSSSTGDATKRGRLTPEHTCRLACMHSFRGKRLRCTLLGALRDRSKCFDVDFCVRIDATDEHEHEKVPNFWVAFKDCKRRLNGMLCGK